MIRYVFPALFFLALTTHVGILRAEEAPAKSEAQIADEAAAAKAAQKKAEAEKAEAEKVAEEKAEEEKKAEEKAEAPAENKAEDKAAAQKAAEQAAVEAAVEKDVLAHQQAAKEVFELTKKVAENLKPEEQKHFSVIYSNYNLISTVKSVRESVGAAVKSCGENNPEMKAGMDARFGEWEQAVDPIIKEADANINNMVVAQEYAKPAQIKKIFKGLDKTRELANKQIDRTPVTTADACEHLQETMNDTQANFVRLLQSTLVSVPQIAPASAPAEAPEEKETENKTEESVEPKAEEKSAEKSSEEEPQKQAN